MERLTSERCSGIKTGYWSPATKEQVVQRLAAYENSGLEPTDFKRYGAWISTKKAMPWEGQEVLVIASGVPSPGQTLDHAYMLALYDSRCGWILEMFPEWRDAEVSHWMYMPEPPAEEA